MEAVHHVLRSARRHQPLTRPVDGEEVGRGKATHLV